ncbi:plexin-2-like isoform X2 [Mercenaria mercenaria]|nr:plexin-2-like isoform X2 [Mercenaria mercenaria]
MILHDMYTSKYQNYIFVLTTKQVLKIPVQSCIYFSSCEDCVTDPHCEWCFAYEYHRCVWRNSCPTKTLISSNEQCPHMKKIIPSAISDKKISQITVELHPAWLFQFRYRCIFVYGNSVNLEYSSCIPDNTTIQSMQSRIKGILMVKVIVQFRMDGFPEFRGYFNIYQCNSIDRCSECTNTAWKCKWCQYTNQSMCIDSDESCNPSGIAVKADDCPRITNYKIVSDGGIVRDASGMVYLSRLRNYEINIKVTNVPKSGSESYICQIESDTQTLWLNSSQFNENGSVTCRITKEEMTTLPYSVSKREAALQLVSGVSPIDGNKMPVIIYACENLVQPSGNCGQCKSFERYQPHLHCNWNGTHCSDKVITNDTTECGYPEINKVYPLSAYAKATTLVEIGGFNLGSSYNDTVNAVSIAGKPCASIPSRYEPGVKIWCELAPESNVTEKSGVVAVTLANNSTGQYSELFYHLVPVVTSIEPAFGPMSGGTPVSINGRHLNIGRKTTVRIGPKECVLTTRNLPNQLICKTKDMILYETTPFKVVVEIDGAKVLGNMSSKYSYYEDPFIRKIHPLTSFRSGGRTLTVEGINLNVVGKPKIYAVVGIWKKIAYSEIKSEMQTCTKVGKPDNTVLNCPSPLFPNEDAITEEDGSSARLGFEMDDVLSVTAYNLPSNIATIQYFPDPVLTNFTEVLVYNEGRIAIKGKLNRHMLAERDYVKVYIGCELCSDILTSLKGIGCEPPVNKPVCWKGGKQPLPIDVEIGYFRQRVGFLAYKEDTTTPSITTAADTSTQPISKDAEITAAIFTTSDDPNNMITVVIVLAVLIAAIIAIGIISLVFYRRHRNRRDGELNTHVLYRRNETTKSNVNRNTSAVSHISRRATTVIYDVIADADDVNEYHELSGEDLTYTQADEYIDPHPYHKIDSTVGKSAIKNDTPADDVNGYLELSGEDLTYTQADEYIDPYPYHNIDGTVDQSAIKNDTPVSDEPENMDLQQLEKSSRSDVPGFQEKVDKLQNDANDGKVNPAENQESSKDATGESKSTEKDDWKIDDYTPNVDGGYIHPVWSQELRESKRKIMLETPRSSYVLGKSVETSKEGLASGQGHTVDNDDGFINASGGQEKDLELVKQGEKSESADLKYKENEKETTLEEITPEQGNADLP